ncbi:MAG: hypothetical protein A2096_14795 [Spirochaetes bacterium GWF1_41_5]|nr:MAG: hypothetical protein A2096_14795 [Spirochaetes bacterium GWF1_41_5]
MQADAYFFAVNLCLIFFIFFEELIQPCFLPVFLNLKKKSPKDSHAFFSAFFIYFSFILAALTALCYFFPQNIVSLFAPGFSKEKILLSAQIFKIMSLAVFFQGLSVLLYYYCNSFKFFFIPAFSHAAQKLFSALGIILLARFWGIKSLAVSFFIACAVQFLIICAGMLAKKIYSFGRFHFARTGFKQILLLMLPLFVGNIFSIINGRVDDACASLLENGVLSALNYAKKVGDVPLLLLPYSLGIVLFPYFSDLQADSGNRESLKSLGELFNKWFIILFFIFSLLEIYILVMNREIISFVYRRGAFSAQSVQWTAEAFFWRSTGMVFFALEMIIMQMYFSCKDTATPIITGIVCALLNIGFTIIFTPHFQHIAIASSYSLQKILKVILLMFFLQKKIGLFNSGFLPGHIKKFIFYALPLTLLLLAGKYTYEHFSPGTGFFSTAFKLGLTSIIFFLPALIMARYQKTFFMHEFTETVYSALKNKIG